MYCEFEKLLVFMVDVWHFLYISVVSNYGFGLAALPTFQTRRCAIPVAGILVASGPADVSLVPAISWQDDAVFSALHRTAPHTWRARLESPHGSFSSSFGSVDSRCPLPREN